MYCRLYYIPECSENQSENETFCQNHTLTWEGKLTCFRERTSCYRTVDSKVYAQSNSKRWQFLGCLTPTRGSRYELPNLRKWRMSEATAEAACLPKFSLAILSLSLWQLPWAEDSENELAQLASCLFLLRGLTLKSLSTALIFNCLTSSSPPK